MAVYLRVFLISDAGGDGSEAGFQLDLSEVMTDNPAHPDIDRESYLRPAYVAKEDAVHPEQSYELFCGVGITDIEAVKKALAETFTWLQDSNVRKASDFERQQAELNATSV